MKNYPEPSKSEGRVICPICGKSYSDRSGYRYHYNKVHRGKEEEVAKKDEQEKEERKEQAKIRRLERIITSQARELEITDRIVSIVSDSVAEMPDIKCPKLPDYSTHTDETVLLLISDSHVGKKTQSFNVEVFQERLQNLWESMMSIIADRRSNRPLKRIVIVFAGDIVDSESIYPGQAIEGIDVTLVHQIFTFALPKFSEFLNMCLDNFEEVEVKCTPGNHGRQNQAKWVSAKSSNWDVVFYKSLEAMFQKEERITFDIPLDDWKLLFEIEGHGFLATHGNMINVYYNLPFYGATRQAQRWQAAFRRKISLTYFLFGHFHTPNYITFNQAHIVFNGSFVTDDKFAEEQIGVASDPTQMLMGVHPKFGITWRYPLYLDRR